MVKLLFGWGTARIQQGLYKLPDFMKESIPCVQGVRLSRKAINDVLKKHGINGYKHNYKHWKFFRAKEPDELWQIDLKGPFSVHGKKHWFLVCIDDYSRYLVLAVFLMARMETSTSTVTLPSFGFLGLSL